MQEKQMVKNNFFANHPRTKIMVILLSLVLLFVVVFLITKIALDGGLKKEVDLPDLTGKTQAEAEQILKDSKLIIEIGDAEASSDVPEGKIISQDPPYENGKKVEEGSKVKIILSKGPETADLPSFTGLEIDSVRATAKEMGLKLEETQENSDKVEEGKVISQSIKAGTKVKSGDTIKIVVSSGVAKTTVPQVTEMDEGTAKATLTNSKLKANVKYKSDLSKDNGKVLSQSIEQGKEVAIGTTVDIVVNKKEEKNINLTVVVPSAESSSTTNSTNSTVSNTVTVSVLVDGTEKIHQDSVTPGETLPGTITGTGNKKIEVRVNGKTVRTRKVNLDEYGDGESIVIQ